MKKLIKKIFQPNNLSKQLVVWFLLISLLPLGIVTSLVYVISSTSDKKENLDKLVVIADSKVDHIESYIRTKQNNVAALSQFSNIVEAIEQYQSAIQNYGINSKEYAEVNRQFKPLFKNYLDRLGYENVFLLSKSKNLLFSLKKNDFNKYSEEEVNFKHPGIARVFDLSKTLMQVQLSNYEHDRETKEPNIFIASPVFKNRLIIGVIIFQINNRELYRVINDYNGLEETGETIVGQVKDDKIVFITPTRHDPNAAFQRSIPISEENSSPLQNGTRGITGTGIYIDYRDRRTLAAWRYLPSFNAGIVVKIDYNEAMASVITNRNIIISLGITTFILTILAATAASKSISHPVVELTKVAKNIAAGEWDRSINIKRKDELGELAVSFNSMALQLKESFDKLEQRVRERSIELRKALEEAQSEARAKDRFLANVSQELRTPVNSILGYTKLVQRESKLNQNQEQKLSIVEKNGNHLLTLIDDIIALSKSESDKMQLKLNNFSLHSFLDGVVAIVRMWAIEKGVQFSYYQDRLPNSIKADEKILRQVLINLLNNVIKFTDRGKVSLQVTTLSLENQDLIRFEIINTGIGLTSEQLEKIFSPFEQVTDIELLSNGTGLSLSVAKKLVELMGGDLQVESEKDRGLRFWFEIPKDGRKLEEQGKKIEPIASKSDFLYCDFPEQVKELKEIESTLAEKQKKREKVSLSQNLSDQFSISLERISGYKGDKRKILIVDDKEENRQLLVNMLKPLGFHLKTANNGQQMLDIASDIRPDIILLDLFMPVKTGLTSARELREMPDFKDIPIIVLSANLTTEKWSKRISCDALLNKPIDRAQLLNQLRKSLDLEWTYN